MANDTPQQRNISQKMTSNLKNAKQQNLSTSERQSSAKQPQFNRIRPQANNASYAGPTQASKAKRTDKVELNLSRSVSFTDKKEASRAYHNDSFASLPLSSPSLIATTSQRNKLVFRMQDQVSEDQQSQVSSYFGSRNRHNDSKRSPYSLLSNSVRSQDGVNHVRTFVGEYERRMNNEVNDAAIGPRTRSTTSIKSKRDDKTEIPVSSVERPNDPGELNVAHTNGISLENAKVRREQSESLYDAAPENAVEDIHSNETDAYNGQTPLTDNHVRIPSRHPSFETELNFRRSARTLQRLQKDFNELADAVKQMSQPTSDDFLEIELLRRLMHNVDCSPEATNLCSELVQLIEGLTGAIQMLNTQRNKARQDQRAKEHNLARSGGDLRLEEAEQRLKEERKQRERVGHKLELFKKKAEEMYQPDLEKKNKNLQFDLKKAQSEKVRLREQVQKYKQRASDWESERNSIQTRAEKETSALQYNIEQQQKEMIYYIEEYHNKMKDEKYWNTEDLHKIIGNLKRELDETMKHFDETKLERARFEEEIIQLKKKIEMLKDDYMDLANGLVRKVELDEPKPKDVAGRSNSRLPKYRLPDEVMKRDAKKAQFRIEQKKRRDEEAAKANFDG
jgi:hypothetical protein